MKTFCAVFVLALLPAAAFGGVIASWDFESANPFGSSLGFFYQYPNTPVPQPSDASGRMEAGNYAIVPGANIVHDLLSSSGDHTSGNGNMMVVNAATAPNRYVWQADFSSTPLTPGMHYSLSFWMTRVYGLDNSPAQLQVDLDQASITGLLTPSQTGLWQQVVVGFTAGSAAPMLRIYDRNLVESGNDFALDDITISAPEPAAWTFAITGIAAILFARRMRRA
jgi:hypothetical protein